MAQISQTTEPTPQKYQPVNLVSKELVGKPQLLAAPKIKYLRVHPQEQGIIKIKPTGTTPVKFEIPTVWANYAKSFICGDFDSKKPKTNLHYKFRIADSVSWCSDITYRTRNGLDLIDSNYVQNVTKVLNRYETHLDDVLAADEHDVIFSQKTTYDSSGAALAANFKRYDNTSMKHLGVEAQYVAVNPVHRLDASGILGNMVYHARVPLPRLAPNTIFEKDNFIKFPEITTLTMKLGPGDRMFFDSDDKADPTGNETDQEVDIEVSNLHILLAINDDPVYEAMLEKDLKTGYTMPLNYVMATQTDRSTIKTGRENVAVTYNSGNGNRLVRIYHSVFKSSGTGSQSVDNMSVDGAKVESYYVKIKDSKTTEEDLSLKNDNPSAYLHHLDLLRGTTVTSADCYAANFVHIEDVGRLGSPQRWRTLGINKSNLICGESLNQDYKYEFVSKTDGDGYEHLTIAIIQRDLYIDSQTAKYI